VYLKKKSWFTTIHHRANLVHLPRGNLLEGRKDFGVLLLTLFLRGMSERGLKICPGRTEEREKY
jgi:hypothetical protein